MARNGSGTYSLPAGQPVVTGTTISSTTFNTLTSDLATAITQSIAYDGQTVPIANLPMGGYKLTGLGAGTALTDASQLAQVQSGAVNWLSSVSGADTITAGISPTPAAYAAGQVFRFVSAGANTGAATLNISSLGAKSITKNGATALVSGDIPASAVVSVVYDGTQFQLQNVSVTNALTGYAKLAVAQSWTAVQTPQNGTASQSTTTSFSFNPASHGQVCTLTVTNAITVTLDVTASSLVAGTTYTIMVKAGDTSARTFAYNSTNVKMPTGAIPISSGATTSGAYDVFQFIALTTSSMMCVGYMANTGVA